MLETSYNNASLLSRLSEIIRRETRGAEETFLPYILLFNFEAYIEFLRKKKDHSVI
jgi:hypothetical protein